ncbi:MAG: TonB-dependent receptor plug domain-containing protein, partial [Candidatus Kapaibacterium sp.]
MIIAKPHEYPPRRARRAISRGVFFLIAITITPFLLPAQDSDTTYTLDEVTVTTDRVLSDQALRYGSVSLITRSEIRQKQALSLPEVISSLPGLYIRDYGGMGGLKTVSIRGSGANQSVILFNGMKINSPQTGTVDLGSIPAELLNSVEVVRGGNSSLYGGGALSGAINMITGPGNEDYIKLKSTYGSFDEKLYSASAAYTTGKLSNKLFIEKSDASGDFDFSANILGRDTTLQRRNAGFENFNIAYLADYSFGGLSAGLNFFYRDNERGTPGAVLTGTVESEEARLSEEDFLGILNLKYLFGKKPLSAAFMYRSNETRYRDPSQKVFGPDGRTDSFDINEFSANARYFLSYSSLAIDLSAGAGISGMESLSRIEGGGSNAERFSSSLSARADYFPFDSGFAPSFLAGIRLDNISDIGLTASPLLGMIAANGSISVRAQWTYNFRAPTFNELYFPNYGNPELSPERSHSFDLGVNYAIEKFSAGISGFYILTENKILSIPSRPGIWTARNIGRTRSAGFEAEAAFRFMNNITLSGNYTFQDVRDISGGSPTNGNYLEYVPPELLSIRFIYEIEKFRAAAGYSYTGFRFSLLNNSYSSLMPEYGLLDFSMGYGISVGGIDLTIFAKANNILDESYRVIKNYPMPGFSFRIG